MIKEAYVSFETAKLLKEKGFDEDILMVYKSYGDLRKCNRYDSIRNSNYNDITKNYFECTAPTHQMAMKWLREVYHIEINITFGFPFINGKQQYKYFWSIVRVCDNHLEYPMDDPNSAFYNEEMADSFEEAVESALKYCLENLI